MQPASRQSRSNPLIASAVPHLVDASEQCHETVNLAVPDGLDIVYAFRIPVRRTTLLATLVGRRRPIHCTSAGRAILSRLQDSEAAAILARCSRQKLTPRTVTEPRAILQRIGQARRDGYAVAIEEALIGEIGVAAPVVNEHGRPVAAIQSSVSTAQWTEARVRAELAPLIMQTARLIATPLARFDPDWTTAV